MLIINHFYQEINKYLPSSKSIAHLRVIIDRYYKITLSEYVFGNKESNQYKFLDCIYSFWRDSAWHIEVYVDRFLQKELIKPSVIVQWVFKCIDKDLEEKSNYQLFWNILFNVIDKTLGKSSTHKKEFRKVFNSGEDEL